MKQFLILLFAAFYLLLASGVSLSLHYCGGKVKNFSFYGSNTEKGCCGNKIKSKGCCKEKTTFFKVKDQHFAATSIDLKISSLKSVPTPFITDLFKLQETDVTYIVLNYHSPPVLYDNPIYLKNKVFLI